MTNDDPKDQIDDLLAELDDLAQSQQVHTIELLPPRPTAPPPQQQVTPTTNEAEVIPLASARARRNLRAELVAEGLHAARDAVDVIRQTFRDGQADFDDAVKALPVVHKIVEHVEKIEASRNKQSDLPMFDIKFDGGGIRITTASPSNAPTYWDADE